MFARNRYAGLSYIPPRVAIGGRWEWRDGWHWAASREFDYPSGPPPNSPPPSIPGGSTGPPIRPPKPCYKPGVGWVDCAPPETLPPPTSGPPVVGPPAVVPPPYVGPPVIGPPMPPGVSPPHISPPWCPDPIQVCPPDAKRIVLNFEATVTAGASAVVTARPQTVFRPDQFIVSSLIAPSFTIDDIKIGNRSQYTAAGRANAQVFSEVSVNSQVKFDTAQGGIDVILNVTNLSIADLDFFATMIGPAIQSM